MESLTSVTVLGKLAFTLGSSTYIRDASRLYTPDIDAKSSYPVKSSSCLIYIDFVPGVVDIILIEYSFDVSSELFLRTLIFNI